VSVLSEYKRSLKLVEVEEILDLVFFRPVAFILVKAIYPTSITPNQLTVFSLAIGILAGVCYGFGHSSAIIFASVLYGLSVILDCADGQLARLKKNGTRLGRILDGLIDYFVGLAVYLGIGIGFAPESGHRSIWWLLIVTAGFSNLFHAIALDYYRNRFTDFMQGISQEDDEDYKSFERELDVLNAKKGKVIRKTAIGLYLKYLNLQKRLTLNWNGIKSVRKFKEEEFYRKNRLILRGWTMLGSTTRATMLIVTSLLSRIDLYFWGMIVVGNIWAAVMFIAQNRIDHSLVEEEVAL
jgi:phosphatidylglycerophosphate synthase